MIDDRQKRWFCCELCTWGLEHFVKCASELNFIQKKMESVNILCEYHVTFLEGKRRNCFCVCLIICYIELTFFVFNSKKEHHYHGKLMFCKRNILERRCWFVKRSKEQCFNSVEVYKFNLCFQIRLMIIAVVLCCIPFCAFLAVKNV